MTQRGGSQLRRIRRVPTAGALALAIPILLMLAAPWSAGAQGLKFLSKAPAGSFDDTDWKLLKAAVVEVLNDQSAGASRAWQNDANKHGGSVRAVKVYHASDGRECKKLQLDSSAGGYKGSSTYSACREPDGGWRDTDGRPLSLNGLITVGAGARASG